MRRNMDDEERPAKGLILGTRPVFKEAPSKPSDKNKDEDSDKE